MTNELLIILLLLALIVGYVAIAVFDRGVRKKLDRKSRSVRKASDPVLDMPEQAVQGDPAEESPSRHPLRKNWPTQGPPSEDWPENGGLFGGEEESHQPPER